MSHKFKTYRHNEQGASLVEFVLVLPVLIAIILTMLELGIILAIKVNLQGCVQAGAYYGQAGQYAAGSSRTASAQAVMMNGLWSTLNTANLTVSIQSYPTFAAALSGFGGTPGTGSLGQVGVYKMTYQYAPSNPIVASFFGATKTISATTYVRNEDYFP